MWSQLGWNWQLSSWHCSSPSVCTVLLLRCAPFPMPISSCPLQVRSLSVCHCSSLQSLLQAVCFLSSVLAGFSVRLTRPPHFRKPSLLGFIIPLPCSSAPVLLAIVLKTGPESICIRYIKLFQDGFLRARERAQWVECFLHKHGTPSLNLQSSVKTQAWHICNLRAGNKTRRFLGLTGKTAKGSV